MKSMPAFCVLPLITNLALYLSSDPSALRLTLYTHLLLIAFFQVEDQLQSKCCWSVRPVFHTALHEPKVGRVMLVYKRLAREEREKLGA